MKTTAGLSGLILFSALLFANDRSVDFDPHTDFSKIRTFVIHEAEVTSQKPELNNSLFAKNLADVIRGELTAKGLKETSNRPDILVSYSIAGLDYSTVERQPDVRIPDGPNGQRGIVIRGSGPAPVRYSEGTLVVDLMMRTTGALIWRGVYRDKENAVTKLAQKLPQDAKKLFAEFPPKNKTSAIQASSPPPAFASSATTHLHLDATVSALVRSLETLHRTVPVNKGGNVEKAIADVSLALEHVRAAIAYINQNPDASLEGPFAPSTRPDFNTPPSEVGRNPSMEDGLASLKLSFDELAQAPGGNLGGLRAKAIDDITAAAKDIIAGINAAANRGPGSRGQAQPIP